jgi:hypothetical protein
MRRHIPGLHSVRPDPESNLNGLFLVRVNGATYRRSHLSYHRE